MVLSACTQRAICPAFQSAFIYDKDVLRKKFSYFKEDSTPKILTASKTKYLIAEPVAYSRKVQMLQTIEMKDIMPIVPDSLTMGDDQISLAELDKAARSVIDSTYIVDIPEKKDSTQVQEDSVYVITKDKEVRMLRYNADSINYRVDDIRYNTDQDNYMWYLRDVIILPDVRLTKLQATEEKAAKAKKGLKGFFKDLFRKKEKEVAADSMQVASEAKSEFDLDYAEETDSATLKEQPEPVKQKKGLFRKKTRTRKPKPEKNIEKKEEEPEEEPVVEEEIEEDVDEEGGF